MIALILAFAKPFLPQKNALSTKETVIYLDDSFSMELKRDGTPLLDRAVQELLKYIDEEDIFTLFTNEKVFRGVRLKEVQNDWLTLPYTTKQLKLDDIRLKGRSFFEDDPNSIKNLIVISDFQQRIVSQSADSLKGIQEYMVQLKPDNLANISLDSIFIKNSTPESIELTALLTADENTEDIPVSLFNGEVLMAKTSAIFDDKGRTSVNFTISDNTEVKGKMEIMDTGLSYDNQLFFTIAKKEKIKVLAIGLGNHDFLKRIYTSDEFLFNTSTLKTLDYSKLEAQNLIILNELQTIPNALVTSLHSFTSKGGWLTVIPAMDIETDRYNSLGKQYGSTTYGEKKEIKRNITTISFSHPLYKDVFEENVTNFQYPNVLSSYQMRSGLPFILGYSDQLPFLLGNRGVHFFTAPISQGNSNFKNSPLIVPTFYSMGYNSLKLPQLYTPMEKGIAVDVPLKLENEEILKVGLKEYQFIPLQNPTANKVTLTFDENPKDPGVYGIYQSEKEVGSIGFNHLRKEGKLEYLDARDLTNGLYLESMTSLFSTIEKDNRITELWKWFIILAILFLLAEILIQKFLP